MSSIYKIIQKLENINENIDADQHRVGQMGPDFRPGTTRVLGTPTDPANPNAGKLVGEDGRGINGPFTVIINTGERPESRTKTKKFRREDDAILWAEDWLEDFPQYVFATAEITDSKSNVVWYSDETMVSGQGVAEVTQDTAESVAVSPPEFPDDMPEEEKRAAWNKWIRDNTKRSIEANKYVQALAQQIQQRKQTKEQGVAEVAGPEKCWPGYRKVGTKPGTGKNAGKRVNDCEKIKEEDIEESGLQYHTGVKKHGAEYMKKAAAAGREGASQAEIGRLRDKYSKAYKEGVAENDDGKMAFTVTYYSPRTDRTVTKTVQASSESVVWDALKAKNIDVISVKTSVAEVASKLAEVSGAPITKHTPHSPAEIEQYNKQADKKGWSSYERPCPFSVGDKGMYQGIAVEITQLFPMPDHSAAEITTLDGSPIPGGTSSSTIVDPCVRFVTPMPVEGKEWSKKQRGVAEDSVDLAELKLKPGQTRDEAYKGWNLRWEMRSREGEKQVRGVAMHSKSEKTPPIKLVADTPTDLEQQLKSAVDQARGQNQIKSNQVTVDFNAQLAREIIGHGQDIWTDIIDNNGQPLLLLSTENQGGMMRAQDRTAIRQRSENRIGMQAFGMSGKRARAAGLTHARYALGTPIEYMPGVTAIPLEFRSEVHPGEVVRLGEPGLTVAHPRSVSEADRNEMDTPEFQRALASVKQKAQQGPMKTVYDPRIKKYKVVPASEKTVKESTGHTYEDILSKLKTRLGDYLGDVAQAVKDTDLSDKATHAANTVNAVKTVMTDDGHEIRIHGNEDDGFRITIKNKDSKSKFASLKEAEIAAEMYCARRQKQPKKSADYVSEEGKQDACYHKVKSRYKVWPSAYASGALVQCRKVGAKNWGNKT